MTATPCAHGAATLAGPALEDFAFYVLDAVAESIHAGDARAQAWTDYVIARGNLAGAVERGESDTEWLEQAAADAWKVLAPELASTLRLSAADARFLAGQLDEACGRIGTVAP